MFQITALAKEIQYIVDHGNQDPQHINVAAEGSEKK